MKVTTCVVSLVGSFGIHLADKILDRIPNHTAPITPIMSTTEYILSRKLPGLIQESVHAAVSDAMSTLQNIVPTVQPTVTSISTTHLLKAALQTHLENLYSVSERTWKNDTLTILRDLSTTIKSYATSIPNEVTNATTHRISNLISSVNHFVDINVNCTLGPGLVASVHALATEISVIIDHL